MRGLYPRTETPHPSPHSVRRHPLPQGERGGRASADAKSTQLDLARNLMGETDATERQRHLCRQFLVALELAAGDRVANDLFDFALRGDADLFQESAQAGVEDI